MRPSRQLAPARGIYATNALTNIYTNFRINILKKIFPKTLDKLTSMWYNTSVLRGEAPMFPKGIESQDVLYLLK